MFWKIFSVILAATVKTLFAPAMGFAVNLSFGTTFAATAVGGIIGFVFFYFSFFSQSAKAHLPISLTLSGIETAVPL